MVDAWPEPTYEEKMIVERATNVSADDNVMLRFTQSENTSVQLQLVITSKVLNSLDPDHVQTECWA